jgi:hypothetical protein
MLWVKSALFGAISNAKSAGWDLSLALLEPCRDHLGARLRTPIAFVVAFARILLIRRLRAQQLRQRAQVVVDARWGDRGHGVPTRSIVADTALSRSRRRGAAKSRKARSLSGNSRLRA